MNFEACLKKRKISLIWRCQVVRKKVRTVLSAGWSDKRWDLEVKCDKIYKANSGLSIATEL